MSSFPILSTLCPIEGDTHALVTTDTLYPPVKEIPMTPGELEAKVRQVEQESRSVTPPKIPGYKHEPIHEHAIQREEFEKKLRCMRDEQLTTPDVPKTHVIQHGDELVASMSLSATPILYTKSGVRVFTGIFASEEPFRHSVYHEHPYEGVQTYTVNDITFTVDFRNYNAPFVGA
jgi:hypothetical protein